MGGSRWVHEMGQVAPWEGTDGSMRGRRWSFGRCPMVPLKVMAESLMLMANSPTGGSRGHHGKLYRNMEDGRQSQRRRYFYKRWQMVWLGV